MFLCIYYPVQLLNKCEKGLHLRACLGQCNHGPLHVGRPEIWLNSWPAARGLGRDQAVPNTRPMDQKEKTVTDANLIKVFGIHYIYFVIAQWLTPNYSRALT